METQFSQYLEEKTQERNEEQNLLESTEMYSIKVIETHILKLQTKVNELQNKAIEISDRAKKEKQEKLLAEKNNDIEALIQAINTLKSALDIKEEKQNLLTQEIKKSNPNAVEISSFEIWTNHIKNLMIEGDRTYTNYLAATDPKKRETLKHFLDKAQLTIESLKKATINLQSIFRTLKQNTNIIYNFITHREESDNDTKPCRE